MGFLVGAFAGRFCGQLLGVQLGLALRDEEMLGRAESMLLGLSDGSTEGNCEASTLVGSAVAGC
jgi:hypothetical protein